MPETNQKDFTIAIVGGGMCGLACAIGLARAGIKVKVFEAAAKFDEIGAGVGLGPNAVRALKGLGILEHVLKAINIKDSVAQANFRFVQGSGNHEILFEIPDVESEGGTDVDNKGLAIYRPTFLAAIVPLIDPDTVSFSKHLTSITQLESGQYCLAFADGTTHNADLVIGADGIRSIVRDAVVDVADPNKDRLVFANRYIYRGMISVEALKAVGVTQDISSQPLAWLGFGKMMVTYPIKDQTMLNVAATLNTHEFGAPLSPAKPRPWVEDVNQKEMLDAYQDSWGSTATAILRQMTQPSRWTLHTVYPPLDAFVKDRIVLIGDAAHAMVPYLGAGVGQGFEDTYALCRILAHDKVTKDSLNAALALYDSLRRPRANMVLEQSLNAADVMQSLGPGGHDVEECRRRLKEVYGSDWHHDLWHYDLESAVSSALETF
ncbi:hypothetical protein HYPSUDRAFT_200039 [Hypholoma sublateritium FD-334 SS-4]|uniref:FAD-binding domain-containing protein n=1 Tax=Hypholoma sublateritium (strain FD-334 SS-4) TaxID=945553 RepID=A0A0D2LCW2_HYPSF|nr:hypothetical protein HYPSUDRAFT_200039 [Hypholoma sublateritium FD-334 SS-4]